MAFDRLYLCLGFFHATSYAQGQCFFRNRAVNTATETDPAALGRGLQATCFDEAVVAWSLSCRGITMHVSRVANCSPHSMSAALPRELCNVLVPLVGENFHASVGNCVASVKYSTRRTIPNCIYCRKNATYAMQRTAYTSFCFSNAGRGLHIEDNAMHGIVNSP